MLVNRPDSSDQAVARNSAWLALVAFLEALQLLILAGVIFSFIPIHFTPFVQKLFPIYLPEVRPEREMLLYRLFVLAALGLQVCFLYIFRRRLQEELLGRRVFAFAAVSAAWIFIQVFAVFKIFLMADPAWARGLLYGAMAGALLSKIFWPEVRAWATAAYCTVLPALMSRRWARIAADVLVPGLIIFLIYPPDLERVLGRMFVYDKFYHLDGFLMAPAWAHLKGLVLNKDVISQYGAGLPIIMAEFLKWTGGFNYAHAVSVIIYTGIIYYILLYVFLRCWLGSISIAAAGTLLSIKLQLFHWGVVPLVWVYQSPTPLRHFPDILFLFFLLRHIRTGRNFWLWSAVIINGLTLSWVIDAGVYMLAALLVYLAALAYERRRLFSMSFVQLAASALTVACAVFLLVLWLVQGNTVFTKDFWLNSFEFANLFVQGWGALPMTEGLKDKQFFAFLVGFAIPCVYVWTLITAGSLLILRRVKWENILLVVMCVYGLGLYHYFIHRSGVTSHYAVAMPLVLLICFGVSNVLSLLQEPVARVLKLLLPVLVGMALVTSYLFTYYPNILNLGGLDWSGEKKAYRESFDFSKDAALIKVLTRPGEKVALISSFETKILIQADRPPFFYYFPLIESAHMQSEEFRGTYLHTIGRLKKTVVQLQTQKPSHIFIEKKFLGPLSAQFQSRHETLQQLLGFVREYYELEAEGLYLVALKRK